MTRPRQTPEHKRAKSAWRAMNRRCTDKGQKQYPLYGGAGIRVCQRWAMSFHDFLADMGLPPSPKHWLGRKDVTGDYTPENTEWTTALTQNNRRQFCRWVTLNGQPMTAAQAERVPGQPSRFALLKRQEAGFDLDGPPMARLYKRSQWITYQGQTLPLPEWAKRIGLSPMVLWGRINRGMPLETAMTPHLFRNHTKEQPHVSR